MEAAGAEALRRADDGPRLRGKKRPRGEGEGVEAEGDVAWRAGHGRFEPGESEGEDRKGPAGM